MRSATRLITLVSYLGVALLALLLCCNTASAQGSQPLRMTLIGVPTCPVQTLSVEFSRPVHRDSLYAAAFDLQGAALVLPSRVQPEAVRGDSARRARLTFMQPIDFGGDYELRYRVRRRGASGATFSSAEFSLTGCALRVTVEILGPNTLCAGDEVELRARVRGGLRGTYAYTWSPTPTTQTAITSIGPIDGPTTVRVDVTDANGSIGFAEVLVTPRELPVIIGGDQLLCQGIEPFELQAEPAGGLWYAAGLVDISDRRSGSYDPSLLSAVAPTDLIRYRGSNGCFAEATYLFDPLDDGGDEAACPGVTAFQLRGGSPAGGQWEGQFVSPDGTFAPPATPGVYTVTYRSLSGCSGTKVVTIAPLGELQEDRFCESGERVTLQLEPAGGRWNGAGIVSPTRGYFLPRVAGAGITALTYSAPGCIETTFEVTVDEIAAGPDFTACPTQTPFDISTQARPAGGRWTGTGTSGALGNTFDPSIGGSGAKTLTYTAPNGCTDGVRATVITTYVRPDDDTITVCLSTDAVRLAPNEPVLHRPLGGLWTGEGVAFDGAQYSFSPPAAGPGYHVLTYVANECAADITFEVEASPEWRGDTICAANEVYVFDEARPELFWLGDFIINPGAGVFDAAAAGPGEYDISAVTRGARCSTTATVTIPASVALALNQPSDTLCHSSAPLQIGIVPSPTIFYAGPAGIEGDPIATGDLSSAAIGEGTSQLLAISDASGCLTRDSVTVSVLPPLRLSAKPYTDTLCFNEEATFDLAARGGLTAERQITWSDAAGGMQRVRTIVGQTSTTYVATLSDGCSDDDQLKFAVFVHPDAQTSSSVGPRVCGYETTFGAVDASGPNTYQVRWTTLNGSEFVGDEYEGIPGRYPVAVVDESTGCVEELEVELLGFAPVVAELTRLSDACIEPELEDLVLRDDSQGALTGVYTLPDGTQQTYVAGATERFNFVDTGTFLLTLLLEGEAGCTAVDSVVICVDAITRVVLPNVFSPNGDDINDTFRPLGTGIYDVVWEVYNRWGTVVFRGGGADAVWDGTFDGRPAPEGGYAIQVRFRDVRGRERVSGGSVVLLR